MHTSYPHVHTRARRAFTNHYDLAEASMRELLTDETFEFELKNVGDVYGGSLSLLNDIKAQETFADDLAGALATALTTE